MRMCTFGKARWNSTDDALQLKSCPEVAHERLHDAAQI